MSLYIDKKYVSLLSPKLKNFKQRGEFLWNFSCPICGDSKKDKLKARGYIYKKKEHLFFMCHNCHTSTTFQKFLKDEDPMLYRDFVLDSFVQPNTTTPLWTSRILSPNQSLKNNLSPYYTVMPFVLMD